MKKALYKHIAQKLDAIEHCIKANNTNWIGRHEDSIYSLVNNYMPSGSGIDTGTKIELSESTSSRIVFYFSYHHMDEGMYSRWTEHKLIVTPSMVDSIETRITGRDYNDIKDYLYQTFDYALRQEVEE